MGEQKGGKGEIGEQKRGRGEKIIGEERDRMGGEGGEKFEKILKKEREER